MITLTPDLSTIMYDTGNFGIGHDLHDKWYAGARGTVNFVASSENPHVWLDEFIEYDIHCVLGGSNPWLYLQPDGTWEEQAHWFDTKKLLMASIALALKA